MRPPKSTHVTSSFFPCLVPTREKPIATAAVARDPFVHHMHCASVKVCVCHFLPGNAGGASLASLSLRSSISAPAPSWWPGQAGKESGRRRGTGYHAHVLVVSTVSHVGPRPFTLVLCVFGASDLTYPRNPTMVPPRLPCPPPARLLRRPLQLHCNQLKAWQSRGQHTRGRCGQRAKPAAAPRGSSTGWRVWRRRPRCSGITAFQV